ncbi:3-oxoacyl-(acyl-carrier-protein) synthase II [Citrus sinensis]|uniref:3-oxoacyl-(Acyl-carrier-protein) synthase II n=1 Tax=Citrus sinensis TaxID=2711 RepID=A0ACB8JA83_CITSI|nr:3-oxoacyl-(acyl-carrier-protein) synthase II [Citrus sinensis]
MAASCLPCTWLPAFELDHALEPLRLLSSNRRLKLISPLSCNNSNSTSFGICNGFLTIRKRRQSQANQAAAYSATVSAKSEKVAPEVKRRVVVTGLGAVTPLGDDAHLFYTKLLEGVSGISQIEGFDCSELPTRIAGEIKTLSTDGLVPPKHAKRADNYLIYALIAGKKALADAGITEQVSGELNKNRCGVLIGTAMGSMRALKDGIDAIKISYKKMTCATGNCCILTAANHIIEGDADMMLCGGSDGVIIPECIAGFIACNNLSRRNSDPTKASRPWDSVIRITMDSLWEKELELCFWKSLIMLREDEQTFMRSLREEAPLMLITYLSPVLMVSYYKLSETALPARTIHFEV